MAGGAGIVIMSDTAREIFAAMGDHALAVPHDGSRPFLFYLQRYNLDQFGKIDLTDAQVAALPELLEHAKPGLATVYHCLYKMEQKNSGCDHAADFEKCPQVYCGGRFGWEHFRLPGYQADFYTHLM